MRFVYYNIWLPWSAKVDSTPIDNINKWENVLKTHKTKNNNFKKQITKTRKTKLSLQLFLMANLDRVNGPIQSLKRTTIWEYPKIGPWFEIMTSLDADLRSGCRLEAGRRSESFIYIYKFLCSMNHKAQGQQWKYMIYAIALQYWPVLFWTRIR